MTLLTYRYPSALSSMGLTSPQQTMATRAFRLLLSLLLAEMLVGLTPFVGLAACRFRSDRSIAYAWLERIQKSGSSHPLAAPQMCDVDQATHDAAVDDICRTTWPDRPLSECRSELDRQIRSAMDRELPTRLENPVNYFTLEELARDITAAGKKLGYDAPQHLSMGTSPDPVVNAQRIAIGNEELVVINAYLLEFANEIAKVAAYLVATSSDDRGILVDMQPDTIVARAAQPDLPRKLASALSPFLHVGPSNVGAPSNVSWSFTSGIELFAIGHEYAHMYLKHATVERRELAPPAKEVGFSWKQELEADYLGARLMGEALQIRARRERGVSPYVIPGIGVWGADLYFIAEGLVERSKRFLDHGDSSRREADMDAVRRALSTVQGSQNKEARTDGSVNRLSDQGDATHPPSTARRLVVRAALTGRALSAVSESTDRRAGEGLAEAFDLIWERSKVDLAAIAKSAGEVRTRPPGGMLDRKEKRGDE